MWRKSMVWALCALATAAQAASAAPAAASGWSFQALGTLGGNASWAAAINNAGEVVGWAGVRPGEFTDIDPEFHAFVYSAGSMRDLGPVGSNGAARAINDRGVVAGSYDAAGVVTWRRDEPVVLPFRGTPNRISAAGTIVGTYDSPAGDFRGFVYRSGVLTEIGTLGGSWSQASAMNEQGVVVGSSATAAGAVRGFVYRGGRMRALGTFGGAVSQAYDVNERGVVVGSAGNAAGGVEAFIDDGAMRPLFPAASPYDVSEAFAINARGQVVGILNDAGFVWDGSRLTMLRDLLTAEQRAQWGVLTPQDINDRGWIVGVASTYGVNGIAGGYRRAFVLAPPEAASGAPRSKPRRIGG